MAFGKRARLLKTLDFPRTWGLSGESHLSGFDPTAYISIHEKRIPPVSPLSAVAGVRMSRFFFGMITGALLLYVAMHYHVVRGNEGVFLVPKISNNLSDVYVDTRNYELSDWNEHKPLAAAIMQSNQSHLLKDASLNTFRDSIRGLVDGLFGNR
jgi:hypothetical protein